MDDAPLRIYSLELSSIPPLSELETPQIDEDFQAGGEKAYKAQERLILGSLRLAVKIAGGFRNMGLELEDLVSEANVGLVIAAKRYDPKKGSKFISYAALWMKQRIRKALCEKSRTIRIPNNSITGFLKIREFCAEYNKEHGGNPTLELLSKKFAMSKQRIKNVFAVCETPISMSSKVEGADSKEEFGDMIEDSAAKNAFQEMSSFEENQLVRKAFALLTKGERFILAHRFGLEGKEKETLVEIGVRLKVSREYIRKIEVKAINRMRQIIKTLNPSP